MAVGPDGLDGVTAYRLELYQPKCLRAERLLWRLINVAHDITFAFATGAGARAPELFERDERLSPIFPAYGEFVADWLQVQRPHTEISTQKASGRRMFYLPNFVS